MSVKIRGKRGTILYLKPEDLESESGLELLDSIIVELKELHSQRDLILANAQTICNDSLLESGGAYYIGVRSGRELLRLKSGKKMKIEFPEISSERMTLFYGNREFLASLNWVNAFTPLRSVIEKKENSIQYTSTAPDRWILVRNNKGQEEVITRIEYEVRRRDLGEGDCLTVLDDNYGFRQRGNDKRILTDMDTMQAKVYSAININKLGWINCDRFVNMINLSSLKVEFGGDSNLETESVKLFLIFKDINSVMHEYYFLNGLQNYIYFHRIPLGQSVRLIAISKRENDVLSFSKDFTLGPDDVVHVKMFKTEDSQLLKLFDI
jgi:hypothetical protein